MVRRRRIYNALPRVKQWQGYGWALPLGQSRKLVSEVHEEGLLVVRAQSNLSFENCPGIDSLSIDAIEPSDFPVKQFKNVTLR